MNFADPQLEAKVAALVDDGMPRAKAEALVVRRLVDEIHAASKADAIAAGPDLEPFDQGAMPPTEVVKDGDAALTADSGFAWDDPELAELL